MYNGRFLEFREVKSFAQDHTAKCGVDLSGLRTLESCGAPLQSPQTPKFSFSFPPGSHVLSSAGKTWGQPLGGSGFSWGPPQGTRLVGAQRQDPVALCSVGRAARTRAPVNGLSKENFCFSFAVGSCPAASNEKCAFSRDSGAGDLCGNRPHPRGLRRSAEPRGCSARARLEESRCLAPSSARFYGAPLHLYLQDILQPLPQGAERFIAVK